MFKVNIYIDSSIKSVKKQTGWYGTIIEYIKSNGEPEQRELYEKVEATRNHTMLIALVESLKKLNRECDVTISMNCPYVCNNVVGGRIKQWKMNGWKTAKNEAVANEKEWKQLDDLLTKHGHKLTFRYDKKNDNHKKILDEIQIRKDGCEKWEQQRLLQ